MANEFHTLNGECSSLVPSGPGYEGLSLANQVCPIVGAQAGESTVSGSRYVSESFNYEFGHIWRVSALHLCDVLDIHLVYVELCYFMRLGNIFCVLSPHFHGIQHPRFRIDLSGSIRPWIGR